LKSKTYSFQVFAIFASETYFYPHLMANGYNSWDKDNTSVEKADNYIIGSEILSKWDGIHLHVHWFATWVHLSNCHFQIRVTMLHWMRFLPIRNHSQWANLHSKSIQNINCKHCVQLIAVNYLINFICRENHQTRPYL